MIEAAHSSAGDDGEPFPPGPLASHVGLLKGAVYTMGVMLVLGAIVLIGAIAWKAWRLPAGSARGAMGFEALDVAVPAGAAVRSVEIDGDRMAVTVEGAQSEIIILDLSRGKVVGRVRFKSEAPGAGEAASSP